MHHHDNYAVPCYIHYSDGKAHLGCSSCELMGDLYVQGTLDARPPGAYSAILCFDTVSTVAPGSTRDIILAPKDRFRPMAMRVPHWVSKVFTMTGFFVAKKLAWDVAEFNAGATMMMFDCFSAPIEIVGPIAEVGEEIMLRVRNDTRTWERCQGVMLGRRK